MSQFPALPDSLTTRQVECISCREIFVVSEDQYANQNQRTHHWRLAVNGYPETHLRFQPNRGRRPVTPEARAEPVFDELPTAVPTNQEVYINCPRCGVDNRNWVKIRYIERYHTLWSQRWLLGGGIFVAFLMAVAAYFAYQGEGYVSQRYKSTFFVVVFLAGILPLLVVPRKWREWRDFKYAQSLLAQQSRWQKLAPPIRKSGILFLGLVVGLPLFFFILLPWALSGLTAVLTYEPRGTLVEQIDYLSAEFSPSVAGVSDLAVVQVAMNRLNEIGQLNGSACQATHLIPVVGAIDNLNVANVATEVTRSLGRASASLNQLIENNRPFCNNNWVNTSLLELSTAANHAPLCQSGMQCQLTQAEIMTVYHQLEGLDPFWGNTAVSVNVKNQAEVNIVFTQILEFLSQNPVAPIENEIQKQIGTITNWLSPQSPNWFEAGVQFLIDWGWFTGLASLMAIIISLGATDRYIRKVDEHLPRPVYYSTANMTRIAIWESNRALEIGETLRRIQWTGVRRNSIGGIDLVGLFRDPPEMIDGLMQNKVRAQEYRIRTDRWCRIENATILDKMVDLPANSPVFVHPPDVLPVDALMPTERPLR